MTLRGPNEADTCADYVLPAIKRGGWRQSQITEQFLVQADLAIPVPGATAKRRADYVLELEPGAPLIVIEAKRLWSSPGDGLQQAVRYASMLDAPFALSTNGKGWVLHNLIDGTTSTAVELPTRTEAWDLYTESHQLGDAARDLLLARFSQHHRASDGSVRRLRYYLRNRWREMVRRRSLCTGCKTCGGNQGNASQSACPRGVHLQSTVRMERLLCPQPRPITVRIERVPHFRDRPDESAP